MLLTALGDIGLILNATQYVASTWDVKKTSSRHCTVKFAQNIAKCSDWCHDWPATAAVQPRRKWCGVGSHVPVLQHLLDFSTSSASAASRSPKHRPVPPSQIMLADFLFCSCFCVAQNKSLSVLKSSYEHANLAVRAAQLLTPPSEITKANLSLFPSVMLNSANECTYLGSNIDTINCSSANRHKTKLLYMQLFFSFFMMRRT